MGAPVRNWGEGGKTSPKGGEATKKGGGRQNLIFSGLFPEKDGTGKEGRRWVHCSVTEERRRLLSIDVRRDGKSRSKFFSPFPLPLFSSPLSPGATIRKSRGKMTGGERQKTSAKKTETIRKGLAKRLFPSPDFTLGGEGGGETNFSANFCTQQREEKGMAAIANA